MEWLVRIGPYLSNYTIKGKVKVKRQEPKSNYNVKAFKTYNLATIHIVAVCTLETRSYKHGMTYCNIGSFGKGIEELIYHL